MRSRKSAERVAAPSSLSPRSWDKLALPGAHLFDQQGGAYPLYKVPRYRSCGRQYPDQFPLPGGVDTERTLRGLGATARRRIGPAALIIVSGARGGRTRSPAEPYVWRRSGTRRRSMRLVWVPEEEIGGDAKKAVSGAPACQVPRVRDEPIPFMPQHDDREAWAAAG
jgi:hypothetical protein